MNKDSRNSHSKEEYNNLINQLKKDYDEKLFSQQERIFSLIEDNRRLKTEYRLLQEKEEMVTKALISAREKASDIELTAEKKFEIELDYLKKFHIKCDTYINKMLELYPIDKSLENSKLFMEKLGKILSKEGSSNFELQSDKIQKTDELFNNSKLGEEISMTDASFNPLKKVNDYIKRKESDSEEFDLQEVLNPKGELSLEALCKELGLMD